MHRSNGGVLFAPAVHHCHEFLPSLMPAEHMGSCDPLCTGYESSFALFLGLRLVHFDLSTGKPSPSVASDLGHEAVLRGPRFAGLGVVTKTKVVFIGMNHE